MVDSARRHVVIAGGGIAGLACAEALRRHPVSLDIDVTILESRRATGGRAGSFRDPGDDGRDVDYCQHVTMGCCTNLLAMLARVDLLDRWTRYRELTFYHPDHGRMPFRSSRWLPAPLHLSGALSGLRFLNPAQRREIRRAMWMLMRTSTNRLIDVSAERWLCEAGQSESSRRCFWDVILVSALGDVCRRVSMAAARKVMMDGFACARDAGDVWVPNRPLSEIFGVDLPDWLRRVGVQVRTGTTVRAVRNANDGLGRVAVELAGDEVILASDVVLAMPWNATRRLLDSSGLPTGHDDLDQLESSPITGIHLWLDRPLTQLPHVVMVGTVSQWLFREPLWRGGNGSRQPDRHYHQVVISGRHSMSGATRSDMVDHIMMELNQAFPEAGGAVCLQSRVVTDPNSVFTVSPSSYRVRPTPMTSHPRVRIAGDWVQTGWPATMESAVISGAMAASSILDAIGPKPPGPSGKVDRTESLVQPAIRRGLLARVLIRP
ncbi:MAG: hydroxysqualene dehydroxylase HpnE [Planctomycetota bacterium]